MGEPAARPRGLLAVVVLLCLGGGLVVGVGGVSATGSTPAHDAAPAPATASTPPIASLVGPASASAPATGPCDAVERPAVVATTGANAPHGPGESVGVYRGSAVDLVLCEEPGGDRSFQDDAPDGLEFVEHSAGAVRVRIDAATNDSLGTLVDPDVPGPGVAVRGARVETSLLDAPLAVASAERAGDLAAAEVTYRDRAATYRDRLDSLANATAAIEAGGRPGARPLDETLAARDAYRSALSAYREELYAVAEDDGSRDAGRALLALDARDDDLRTAAGERLAAYDAAMADRERSLTGALRLRIAGLGVVGLLVGAVAGAALPVRRGRLARRRLARGEWTTYSRRAVLVPAAVGALLLLAGAGWLLVETGTALQEVLW